MRMFLHIICFIKITYNHRNHWKVFKFGGACAITIIVATQYGDVFVVDICGLCYNLKFVILIYCYKVLVYEQLL